MVTFALLARAIDVTYRTAPPQPVDLPAPGPVIVGVHVDYRDNHLPFEMVKGDNIH